MGTGRHAVNLIALTAIRLHWVQVPLWEPFRISNGEIAVKDAILVELEVSGKTAWGEASPLAGSAYSGDTPESAWNFLLNQLLPALLEQKQIDPLTSIYQLAERTSEPFARAGLEGALWDLRAQQVELPLWSLLGGQRRPIPSGAAIGLMDKISDLLARVERFLGEGYRRIKIKIAPGHDIELVRAVREKFGNISLMVDANAAYRPEDTSIFEELDKHDLMMIEQPLARESLAEHAELQRRLRTPICLDESAESLEALCSIIKLGSGKILNIKVQRMGGLWPAKQAHDLAAAAGIPCWLGTMPELGIASAQSLHLATLPGFTLPSDVEASDRWFVDDVIDPPVSITPDGFICLPQQPGMGYEVVRDRVAKYRIRFEELRP
jgi:O-succinylbenzoate synthase